MVLQMEYTQMFPIQAMMLCTFKYSPLATQAIHNCPGHLTLSDSFLHKPLLYHTMCTMKLQSYYKVFQPVLPRHYYAPVNVELGGSQTYQVISDIKCWLSESPAMLFMSFCQTPLPKIFI